MAFIDTLLPAPRAGGFTRPEDWVWCGSVVCGPDGLNHMFASMWSKRVPFNPNWLTHSRVVRATSLTPEGPYVYVEDVLPPRGRQYWDGCMTHNPTVHRRGETYLLFYTGTTFGFPASAEPVTGEQRLEARANQRIGVATAPHPAGPWTRYDAPILQPRPGKWDALITTNPAPCIRPDGRVLLYYKSVAHDRGTIRYGVAGADDPLGPYERLRDEPLFQFDDPTISVEDAYVWHQKGRFHLVLNDMTGKITGEDHAGALAHSDDGLDWRFDDSPKAYSRTVRWDDGTTTVQGSFERPQLLLHDGRPTHLFAATADGPGGWWRASHTWNMVVPLRGA